MSKQSSQAAGGTGGAGGGEGGESRSEQQATFRLDALGGAGSGSMLEGPPKRQVPVQAVVLVALVVLAAGALYAMRRLGMGPMGAIAEVKMDYDLEKVGAKANDHKKLLADLSTSQVEHQVPADKVQKNPFKMLDLKPQQLKDEPKKPVRDLKAEEEAKRQREREDAIKTALATMKVHTVLTGTVPVARINDENVRVGDTVAKYFSVTAIYGRTVEVQVDGVTYMLTLDDEVQGRGPVRKGPARK